MDVGAGCAAGAVLPVLEVDVAALSQAARVDALVELQRVRARVDAV
ncbi:MAG: hypothetical protein INR67_15725, partial [Jatrophihabitans endophyticus]|nr:hypothetical protein [Jatrophihabitans endophyticus]